MSVNTSLVHWSIMAIISAIDTQIDINDQSYIHS